MNEFPDRNQDVNQRKRRSKRVRVKKTNTNSLTLSVEGSSSGESSLGPQKQGEFFQNVVKRASLTDNILDQSSAKSTERDGKEIHEQVAGLHRKILGRVHDKVYSKCSPALIPNGKQSMLNQSITLNRSIIPDK